MELNKLQEILARLYTNKNFRREFFANRASVIKEMNCDDHTNQSLFGLDESEVNLYAQGLINKRLGVVKQLLPITSHYCDSITELFNSYAQNTPAEGMHHKHYNDAIAFGEFVFAQSDVKRNNALTDILKYEILIIKTYYNKSKFLFHFFNYPVHNFSKTEINFSKRRTFVLFIRMKNRTLFKIFVF